MFSNLFLIDGKKKKKNLSNLTIVPWEPQDEVLHLETM